MTSLTITELTEAFEYLDELRASGRTNMWGAAAFVEQELFWGSEEAKEATQLWMHTFDGGTPLDDRVAQALVAGV